MIQPGQPQSAFHIRQRSTIQRSSHRPLSLDYLGDWQSTSDGGLHFLGGDAEQDEEPGLVDLLADCVRRVLKRLRGALRCR